MNTPTPTSPASAPPAMNPGDEGPPGSPATGEAPCPRCGGSGRLPDGKSCPDCGGTGRVTRGIGGA